MGGLVAMVTKRQERRGGGKEINVLFCRYTCSCPSKSFIIKGWVYEHQDEEAKDQVKVFNRLLFIFKHLLSFNESLKYSLEMSHYEIKTLYWVLISSLFNDNVWWSLQLQPLRTSTVHLHQWETNFLFYESAKHMFTFQCGKNKSHLPLKKQRREARNSANTTPLDL